jgi:hypothetical protein
LLSGSLLVGGLASCTDNKPKSPEAKRFEQLLAEARINKKDSVRYLVWNDMSCAGCRSYTAQLLQKGTNKERVKMIVPLSFVNDIQTVAINNVFVDSHKVFSKLYFGIDNIGIIDVYNNEVVGIKNYTANEMDSLKDDLDK